MKYVLTVKVETLHPTPKKILRDLLKLLEKNRGVKKVTVPYIDVED